MAGAGMLVMARTRVPVARQVTMATTWGSRLRGLLGRRALPEGEAMVFPSCRSIHTWGMGFPIDAAFVDRSWRVVAVREHLAPWRVVLPVRRAWGVVELPSGTLERTGLRVGDVLQLVEKNGHPA